jgi:putative tryptophan/tyrosine transport system substrate-binding protein
MGATAAWPLAATAQQPGKVPVIGFLGLASGAFHQNRVEAFRAGLRELSYSEPSKIVIEFRWAEGRYERLPELAAELVRRKVDIIITHAVPGVLAAMRATSTIPIVVSAVGDMLELDLVSSLSRPGGNMTGLTFFNPELLAKRLELVKEALPNVSRAGVLLNSANQTNKIILAAMESTAKALNIDARSFEVRQPSDFEPAFAAMAHHQVGAVVVHEDPMLNSHVRHIVDLATVGRLPSFGFPELVRANGLLAYGINFSEMDRRAASFVDRILKGTNPGPTDRTRDEVYPHRQSQDRKGARPHAFRPACSFARTR